jgi:hypothetical protein
MRSFIAAAAIVTVAATSHLAHAAKKVKAEVLCGTIVDGNVTDVVPSPKHPKLTQPVGCALRVEDVGDDTYMANIHTVRYVVDAATGKKSKVETSGSTNDVGSGKDLEFIMTPSTADANGEIDFAPCEDFDVVASVSDDRGVYFKKTLHVAQTCPKPKPMKIDSRCTAYQGDSEKFDLPDKQKRSLDGLSITCLLTSHDARFSSSLKVGGQLFYVAPTMDDSDGHKQSDLRAGTYAEGPDEDVFQVTFTTDDIPVCLPGSFELRLTVDDADSAHLATKSITVKQACN